LEYNTNNIKGYWDSKAEKLKTDPSATMKDVFLRDLEITAISSRLLADDKLLDMGCGNGFGSLKFAEHCKSVLALDYSDKMINMARNGIARSKLKNIQANVGNILELENYNSNGFTAVSSVRCLINLPNEDLQFHSIKQMAGVLITGGKLFLCEGIAENFEAINNMRQQVDLHPIKLDWHNHLFVKNNLEGELGKYFLIEERIDFGEYYFLSRVVHPLFSAPDEPRFQGHLNSVAKAIWEKKIAKERFSDISILVLYVCRKL
jgi:ubiquinone/menaquinone biosynthesis C-methylase UbiE